MDPDSCERLLETHYHSLIAHGGAKHDPAAKASAAPSDGGENQCTLADGLSVEQLRQSNLDEAKRRSHQDREGHADSFIDSLKFSYGEMVPGTIKTVMDSIGLCSEDRVVDLGSGNGKALLALALMFPDVKDVCGIELLEGLHKLAAEALSTLRARLEQNDPEHRMAPVNLKHGSLLEEDWSKATVVLICSTAFDEVLMQGISRLVERLPANARVITTSNKIDSRFVRHTASS